MSVMATEFNSLLHSDLTAAGAEAVTGHFVWIATVSLAHFGIGMLLSAVVLFRDLSVGWLWAGMAAIVLKEVAGDLTNAGFSAFVILDSLWDLFCYLAGFFVQWGLVLSVVEGRK
ncbi:hypothetical protein J7426_23490 [Tropicibacter sp. R16_0]|uniref:hypothetical protein n=1 Tax=Tropicibacter sp. R16_0 TaxID=2821102 RepID=UPI001ADA81A1|nr:hypothetical protein [Tropicibacter sp. R16_0]MBO9453245.1 hypothetical protein [Tropicibacter sp. R16_0]